MKRTGIGIWLLAAVVLISGCGKQTDNGKGINKKHLQKDNPSNIIQEKCKEAQSEKLCASLVFQVLSFRRKFK